MTCFTAPMDKHPLMFNSKYEVCRHVSNKDTEYMIAWCRAIVKHTLLYAQARGTRPLISLNEWRNIFHHQLFY